MAKAVIEKSVILRLSETEATWLKAIASLPINRNAAELRDSISRRNIWEALDKAGIKTTKKTDGFKA